MEFYTPDACAACQDPGRGEPIEPYELHHLTLKEDCTAWLCKPCKHRLVFNHSDKILITPAVQWLIVGSTSPL